MDTTIIKLLFVEDDQFFRESVQDTLVLTGRYLIHSAKNGAEGFEGYKSFAPDIIVTDLEMPEMSGFELIGKVRAENKEIPIIAASGLVGAQDMGHAFRLDIDNFVKKPYLPMELDNHIKAIMKRIVRTKQIENDNENNKLRQLGKFIFDSKGHCLILNNVKQKLTPRETQILQLLYDNAGTVVSRKDILEQFWGMDDPYTSRSLDVFINALRKYLEKDPSVQITTIRGEGYNLTF